MSIKQKQIEKYNLLTVLQEELNTINAEQKYHEKLHRKHSMASKSNFTEVKDLERLMQISKRQKEQIKRMTKEIQTLRSKIKPQDQFKLHERLQYERNSPQMLIIPDYMVTDEDLKSIPTPSLDSFPSRPSTE